tara:strand:- start:158 stop:424 length:267 start_codon:yes stop_codon:yes gene_type:complete
MVIHARKKYWATGSDRWIHEMSDTLPEDQRVLGLVIQEAATIEDKVTVLCKSGVKHWFYKNCDRVPAGPDQVILKDKQQLMRRKDIER